MRLIERNNRNPSAEGHTMTERKLKTVRPRLEALVAQDRDLLKTLVKEALDQILQAEMTDFLGAAPGERRMRGVEGYDVRACTLPESDDRLRERLCAACEHGVE